MQDFLLYSAIPGPGRLCPVPACPADSHCVIVYPPAIQIATLDLLNFIKNESWVPCKMQNGGMEAAAVISSLGEFRCHPSQALLQGEGLRAARCTASANGVRNLIPYSSRATARVAPPALWGPCLKPGGRVRTPVPTADIEALPSSVGAGHRPARRLHSSCHLPGSAWHRNSDSHGVKKTGKNEKNAW